MWYYFDMHKYKNYDYAEHIEVNNELLFRLFIMSF